MKKLINVCFSYLQPDPMSVNKNKLGNKKKNKIKKIMKPYLIFESNSVENRNKNWNKVLKLNL